MGLICIEVLITWSGWSMAEATRPTVVPLINLRSVCCMSDSSPCMAFIPEDCLCMRFYPASSFFDSILDLMIFCTNNLIIYC